MPTVYISIDDARSGSITSRGVVHPSDAEVTCLLNGKECKLSVSNGRIKISLSEPLKRGNNLILRVKRSGWKGQTKVFSVK